MRALLSRLTYANVMATVAVFIALGGVTWAAATLPKNSVGSAQLKKNAVTGAKVRDRSLLAKDFKSGQLPRGETGPPGPTEAYTTVRDPIPLLNLEATFVPVVTTPTLPAGSYTLTARVTLLGNATPNRLICSMAGDAAQGIDVAAEETFSLAMTSTVVLTAPQAISMSCLESLGGARVAHATIVATKVGRIVGG